MLILPQSSPNIGHFLAEKCNFRVCNSLQCTVRENAKSLKIKDLQHAQKGAYKPAYKKYQETAGNQLQDVPTEVAEIVAVWPDLPAHIKAAIKALVQAYHKGVE